MYTCLVWTMGMIITMVGGAPAVAMLDMAMIMMITDIPTRIMMKPTKDHLTAAMITLTVTPPPALIMRARTTTLMDMEGTKRMG
mmetsp:Transcript_50104/g.74800  ORF Transcript_50104/g.74800 Transcript_50104/m.74800 type:complete len:84 (-) Transcript_50104:758-1009(-)